MLHYCPEENVVTVLDVQHHLVHGLYLVKFQIVKLDVVSRDKGCPGFSNCVVDSSSMALVEILALV